MDSDREYHIHLAAGELPELVLLPGDPARAKTIADMYLSSPQEVAKNREYWTFKGRYNGVEVGICSTGIGCPAASIALEELIRIGCRVFIRVGTAGAIDPTLRAGDLVILTATVRDDGTSKQYVPVQYPAVADPEIVIQLAAAARRRGVSHRIGIGHCKDAFYSEFPQMTTDPESTRRHWETLKRARVIATEMESAALFVIGQLRGVRVGTVCVIVGEPIENEAKIAGIPPLDSLVYVALDALTSFG